jgi:uncharacterized protein (TIGR02996 family)
VVTEQQLLSRFLASPDDDAVREVYADWLEERDDLRFEFLRAQAEVRRAPPDHPRRLELEARLSRARRGLDAGWLLQVEPERAHLLTKTPARCGCVSQPRPSLKLHDEPQDTECDAWRKLVESIERAAVEQPETFSPLNELSGAEREQIVTLPPAIATLKSVKKLILYGSQLVRLPVELAGMTSLREFVPYTSYRLHWFPYELTRIGYTRSTVSTRALYGNHKFWPPFPRLRPFAQAFARECSVCSTRFEDSGRHRVWLSHRVGTDVLPLLVNACSDACLARLPTPPPAYFQQPHRGGPGVRHPGQDEDD